MSWGGVGGGGGAQRDHRVLGSEAIEIAGSILAPCTWVQVSRCRVRTRARS